MTEEIKTDGEKEGTKDKPTTEDAGEGSESPTDTILKQVIAEREKLDEARKGVKEEIAELRTLRAQEILGGKSVAGEKKLDTVDDKAQTAADDMVKSMFE